MYLLSKILSICQQFGKIIIKNIEMDMILFIHDIIYH